MTAAVNSSSSCVHLPFRKGAFSRCAATRAAAVVALPRGFEGTMGRSPRAAAAAGRRRPRSSGSPRCGTSPRGARRVDDRRRRPLQSQARVAQTGSEGSPPRGALRVRAGGVSVSSGAGLSTLGRAGRVRAGRGLRARVACVVSFLFWAVAGGSRSRGATVEPGPAGDMVPRGSRAVPGPPRAFGPVLCG